MCPVPGQPGLALQAAAWQGSCRCLQPAPEVWPGLSSSGGCGPPRQLRDKVVLGGGGGCDTAEASYSAEHPRLPPEPALPGRWQRAGPSQSSEQAAAGAARGRERSSAVPGCGRAGGTPGPAAGRSRFRR